MTDTPDPLQRLATYLLEGDNLAIAQACNACLLRDERLTDWEREFLCDLMDRRLVDDPKKLSEKQIAVIKRIANKVPDVPPI